MLSYSVDAAIESGVFDKIILTTDSQEYIDLYKDSPIECVLRDPALALDGSSSFSALADVIHRYADYEYDYFVQLQPTSPLRTAEHIREVCAFFEEHSDTYDFCASIAPTSKPTALIREIDETWSMKNYDLDYSNYSRQGCPPEFAPNGVFFIAKPKEYLEHKHFYGPRSIAYLMDKESSVDVDDRLDFEMIYRILQKRNQDKQQEALVRRFVRYFTQELKAGSDAPIAMIGHGILADWSVTELAGQAVWNLGIPTLQTRQFTELILDGGLLTELRASKVLLMLGTNELVHAGWTPEEILHSLQTLVAKLKALNPQMSVYFLELLPTAFRVDRNNADIRQLNALLQEQLQGVAWISLYDAFLDQWNKLDLRYTDDGLHLNAAGYTHLRSLVEPNLY